MKNAFAGTDFGKIAPWVDLVNSEEWDGFGNFADRLENSDWVDSFLRHWRFKSAAADAAPAAQLRQLRKIMRAAVAATDSQKQPNLSPAELAEINRALAVPAKRQLLRDQNGLRLEAVPQRTGWDWVIAEIVRGFADWVLSKEPARVKICRNDECRWLFYDPTKARIKRWCSGKTCGNRMRVRRARAG